jgi:hypothetical protein
LHGHRDLEAQRLVRPDQRLEATAAVDRAHAAALVLRVRAAQHVLPDVADGRTEHDVAAILPALTGDVRHLLDQ